MKLGSIVLLWTPRVLAMAMALFLAMFAMSVFLEGKDFWETSGAFVTHLIPSFCVIAILAIGWRRDGLAALGFLALAIAYFVAFAGWKHLPESLILTLPPLGISVAFYARMRLLKDSKTETGQVSQAPDQGA
ncbi:hypothetical protein KAJ02_00735 [Candidatus Bipolaricaulota bacterium]|nr:hypothetical protein [Candidatus Bipolaricaulota bacterium]MCK5584579.1 hypothetical protein [Candidatus Bipolaricaulota bacterium]